jgi:hypothetical protein
MCYSAYPLVCGDEVRGVLDFVKTVQVGRGFDDEVICHFWQFA